MHATGTRNMNALGGLVRRMPWTAACFVFGAAAIAALPPLNGFVSEWLIFQALLQNVRMARLELNLAFTVGLAALALTSGLTLACFVKAAGITFLAVPRSEEAARAHEAPVSMRAAMVLLAAACVGLGVGPTLVLPALARVVGPLVGSELPALGDGLTVRISGEFAALSPLALAAALAIALLAPLGALWLVGAQRRTRWAPTWACGRILQTARMEYTATAFSNPFKRVFDFFYRPAPRLDIEFHPESRFFVERIEYASPTRSLVEEWLYRPALRPCPASPPTRGAAVRQRQHVPRLHPGRAGAAAGDRVITDLVLALTQALVVAARPLLVGAAHAQGPTGGAPRSPPRQPYADLASFCARRPSSRQRRRGSSA